MTKRSMSQAVVLGLLFAWPAGSPAEEPKPISPIGPGYRLAWHDEFDGDRLDTGKWPRPSVRQEIAPAKVTDARPGL